MQIRLFRLDVTHEVFFATPLFALAQSTAHVLQGFYEAIAPRYQLAPESMRVIPGNSMSEVAVRLVLFNNLTAIDVRPDKMTVYLSQLRATQDLAVAKDVIALAHDGLARVSRDVKKDGSRIFTPLWLIADDGDEAAKKHIAKFATPKIPIATRVLGAETMSYHLRTTFENQSDKWTSVVSMEPSAIPGANLFVGIDTRFQTSGRYEEVASQIQFCEQMSANLMKALELEAAQSGT